MARGMFDLSLELVYHNLKGEFKYAESCALTNFTYARDIRAYLQQMRRWRRSPPEAIHYILLSNSSLMRSRELRTLVLTNHGNRTKPRKSLLVYCLENGNPTFFSLFIYIVSYVSRTVESLRPPLGKWSRSDVQTPFATKIYGSMLFSWVVRAMTRSQYFHDLL